MSTAQRLKGIATIYSQVVKSLLSAGVNTARQTSNISNVNQKSTLELREITTCDKKYRHIVPRSISWPFIQKQEPLLSKKNHAALISKLEALGQCIPLPRHVLPMSRYQSRHLANQFEITTKIWQFVQWPIANLLWKFHSNTFGIIFSKLLIVKQTGKHTN